MNHFRTVLLPIFICLVISCSSDSSSNEEPMSVDTELSISIAQGVYGLTTSYDDVGDNPIEIYSGFNIDVFYEKPSSDLNEDVVPLASAESDDNGFYEIALQSGEYCVCTTFRRCLNVSIQENEALRLDYEYSVGPGWSLPSDP